MKQLAYIVFFAACYYLWQWWEREQKRYRKLAMKRIQKCPHDRGIC